MKAGRTDIEVGTLVRITHIEDAEDSDMVGMIGRITHPFPGLMYDPDTEYVAGLYVEPVEAARYGLALGPLGVTGSTNITRDDRVETVAAEDAPEPAEAGPRPGREP